MTEFVPDIPRLYTALAEWLACVVFISILCKKVTVWKLIAILTGGLIVQSVYLVVTKDLPIELWIPSMLIAVLLMFLLIYKTTDISLVEAGYFSVKAFVLAEFMASLQWQVHYYLLAEESAFSIPSVGLLVSIYAIGFISVWYLEKRNMPEEGRLNIRPKELGSTILIGAAVFFISNLSFVSSQTPFSAQYTLDIMNIRTLVDAGGYAVLFAYHIQLNEMRVKHELESIQGVLQSQYTQYKKSKESVDLINYKYHDLKNQIIALKAEQDPEKRILFLEEMEEGIKSFEAQNKTGNKVLDTVLTSKHMYCIKKGITLTAVADGALLEGMGVADICTIFGNALDNAIEYETKVKNRDKRLIHMTLVEQRGFVMIRFENYFEGDLKLNGELPHTTKKDKLNHGYGLKSIQYSVKKYDGIVDIGQRENWFELKVLIPSQSIKNNVQNKRR